MLQIYMLDRHDFVWEFIYMLKLYTNDVVFNIPTTKIMSIVNICNIYSKKN